MHVWTDCALPTTNPICARANVTYLVEGEQGAYIAKKRCAQLKKDTSFFPPLLTVQGLLPQGCRSLSLSHSPSPSLSPLLSLRPAFKLKTQAYGQIIDNGHIFKRVLSL